MLTVVTPHEFCYWLQGAIEIGELRSVQHTQALLIWKRLVLVRPQNYFAIAAKAILENYPLDVAFAAISEELQTIFQHDIDPSYDGDQNFFHAVHRGQALPLDDQSGD